MEEVMILREILSRLDAMEDRARRIDAATEAKVAEVNGVMEAMRSNPLFAAVMNGEFPGL